SVFCHGAPQVKYNHTRCELADLLVVIDRWDTGSLVRRAVLIQAKMAWRKQLVKLTGPSSCNQLKLYQNWPTFRIVSPGYGNRRFCLSGGRHGEAGSFGVIDRHLINNPTPPAWTQHSPRPTPSTITTEPLLGSFLTRM